LSGLDLARIAKLRAQLPPSLRTGGHSARLLLHAARDIARYDHRLGREALLEALESAVFLFGHRSEGTVQETARAALALPTEESDIASDLLLRGLALLFTVGHEAAVPTLRSGIKAVQTGNELRWMALAGFAAFETWDDRGSGLLVASETEQAGRSRFTPAGQSLVYLAGLDHIIAGQFAAATERLEDIRLVGDVARDPLIAGLVDGGLLLVSAWRGDPDGALDQLKRGARRPVTHKPEIYHAMIRLAEAVLLNGLGHYEESSIAAKKAVEYEALGVSTLALPELIEAAARRGEREIAATALADLAARTIPSGTHWALGMLARSRALLAEDEQAESLYCEAVEQLSQCRVVPHLARAHLLFGEWLRRQGRRREAREQLSRAQGMFMAMSADAFVTRAQGELHATGEHLRPHTSRTLVEELTAQEARVAALAGEGSSNREIAGQLFISSRTVEYHLRKVYRKLGVASRVELANLLIAG
ncbi:MAG: helix-turn-helix transcriptional regulator, partial [Gaiellaceae bacterium]